MRRATLGLTLVLASALVLRVAVATYSPTIVWPDEIFQSLEPAHRLLWGYGVTPWEFHVGARSWLLPGFLAAIMKASAWLARGSVGYLTGVRFVLSLLSLALPASSYLVAKRASHLREALTAACVTAFWFELVFFAPKALAESVAAAPFVLGVALLENRRPDDSTRRFACVGALLASSVALRVHLAPAVMAVVLVSGWQSGWTGWRPFALGFVVPVVFTGALDFATWGAPFHSYAVNLTMNLGSRGALYGGAPWYGYFLVLERVWGWSLPLVLACVLLGAWRARLLATGAVVSLATLLTFSHKEYRFLVPTLAALFVLAGVGVASALSFAEERFQMSIFASTLAAVLSALGWSVVSFERGGSYDWQATSLVGSSGEPPFMWQHLRGSLLAFQALSQDDRVCGVALENRQWNTTGGYAALHRNVPLFPLLHQKDYATYAPSFNVMLARAGGPETFDTFERQECFDAFCIYRRPGACVPAPGYDLNANIAAQGM